MPDAPPATPGPALSEDDRAQVLYGSYRGTCAALPGAIPPEWGKLPEREHTAWRAAARTAYGPLSTLRAVADADKRFAARMDEENAELRARLAQAEGTARLYSECEAELQEIHDTLVAAYGREDLSEETAAVVSGMADEWGRYRRERDEARKLLADAADALWEISKAALTVEPLLRNPYQDAPEWTPWTRWMERPARRAHDLKVRIGKLLKEAASDGG